MNIQLANFEDLLAVYYQGTTAHEAAEHLGDLIRNGENLQLATLLRDYRESPISLRQEIEMRAATDRLMNCYSVMEIASLASFVTEIQLTDFGIAMFPILENKYVRRYYEEFYPTKLPQLLRHRLAGINHENIDSHNSAGNVIAFLALDCRFMETLDDGYLLRMLDSFTFQGHGFSDVVRIISQPEEFINRLLLAPAERDVLSKVLNEFSVFMQFCFDLRQLLIRAEPQPLLQSAMWNHYSYWFDIFGDRLSEGLDKALSKFLEWKPDEDEMEAAVAVQTYVAEARTVLETLMSRRFAEPVNTLLMQIQDDKRSTSNNQLRQMM